MTRNQRKKTHQNHDKDHGKEKPQRKGICVKVLTIKPKKPNSALRKVVKVLVAGNKGVKGMVTAYIPGEGHNLTQHSLVLLERGKRRDLPGIKYRVIRGTLDTVGVFNRKTSRSRYGSRSQ